MGASVLITHTTIPAAARAILDERQARLTFVPITTTPEALAALMAREPFDAVISRTVRITAAAIAGAPALKVIAKHGVGVDNIDVDAATARGIAVMNARATNAQSVAEHAVMLMLAVVRRLIALNDMMREGRWDRAGHRSLELSGKRLGVVGMGAVGCALAPIAQGFGMTVAAYDPYIPRDGAPAGVRLTGDLDAMVAESDFLSLHVPLTDETRGMISRARLGLMKPGAYLVNTARGPVVDEAALFDALASGRLAGAGLDVFTDEPTPPDNPILRLPNVVMTPHIAGTTDEALARVGIQAVKNVYAILDGAAPDPRCLVNPEALKRPATV